MTLQIVTDSACDLPSSVLADLGIGVVPLYVHVGSQVYLDGLDLTRETFYERLPVFTHPPTTAVPSPLKFRELYETLARQGASEILSIHVSSSFSGIVNAAQVAAREVLAVPVTVFDSHQVSLGLGFLVETAAHMARAGCRVADILPALKDQVLRTHLCAALDTLEYLRRSGRVSSILSTLGQVAQLKPLLKVYNGVVGTERVRTRKNALQRLAHLLRTVGPLEKIAFLHTGALEYAQDLIEEVKGLLPQDRVWIEPATPVLGVHVGPGAVGFACVGKEAES